MLIHSQNRKINKITKQIVQLMILPISLMMGPVMLANANDDIDPEGLTYEQLLVADLDVLKNDLPYEKHQLADKIYQRLDNLHTIDYQQRKIDETLDYFMTDRLHLTELSHVNLDQQIIYKCMANFNNVTNFQDFSKYFIRGFMYDVSMDEAEKLLQTLNYFFVDELATSLEYDDNVNLPPGFNYRLEQAGLTSTYQAFLNDNEYTYARYFIGIKVDDSMPYTFLPFLFQGYNSNLCQKLNDIKL